MCNGEWCSVLVYIGIGNNSQVVEMIGKLLVSSEYIKSELIVGQVVFIGSNFMLEEIVYIVVIKKFYLQVLDFIFVNVVQMCLVVMMKVCIMEFDKKKFDEFGIKWDLVIDGLVGGFIYNWIINFYFGVVCEGSIFEGKFFLFGIQLFFGIVIFIILQINLMMQIGDVWELVVLQLVVCSGGMVDFLVGGEVLILICQVFGEVIVDYKLYGIKLYIVLVVNSSGDIVIDIQIEISKIDFIINVFGYLGFFIWCVEMQMNVYVGDIIVIFGLVDFNVLKIFDKVFGLGDILVFGVLFCLCNFQCNCIDLVMFIMLMIVEVSLLENCVLIDKSNWLCDDLCKIVGSEIVD